MQRKCIASVLAILLLVMLAGCISQPGTKLAIGDITLSAGETATVRISVINPPDIKTIQVGPTGKLTFDPSVIQINSITGVNGFRVFSSSIDNIAGEAVFLAGFPGSSIGPVVNSGLAYVKIDILELEVEAVGSGSTNLDITQVDVFTKRNNKDVPVVSIYSGEAKVG